MAHNKLNYECAMHIQEEVLNHTGSLEVIISLLRSSNESYHLDQFDFKLGVLIESWLDELITILNQAVDEARNDPLYALKSAKQILKLSNEEAFVSQERVDDAIKLLGSVVDNYGSKAFPESATLLGSMYELREKITKKTKKAINQ